MLPKQEKHRRIHKRIRTKIYGTKERPRLFVFKSNKHLYAQLIDDKEAKVLSAFSDIHLKSKKGKIDNAFQIGRLVAKAAIEKRIGRVVFDRGGFMFHGRVKAVADGAREGGLRF